MLATFLKQKNAADLWIGRALYQTEDRLKSRRFSAVSDRQEAAEEPLVAGLPLHPEPQVLPPGLQALLPDQPEPLQDQPEPLPGQQAQPQDQPPWPDLPRDLPLSCSCRSTHLPQQRWQQ